jgi:hypothetical protein
MSFPSMIPTQTVEIPGEFRLSHLTPLPMTVRLPLVARPNRLKNFLVGSLIVLNDALFGLIFTGLVLILPDTRLSGIGGLIFLLMLLVLLFAVVIFTGVAFTCFRDALRTDPVLEISADGIGDCRSGLSVPWSLVRSARILGDSVDLQLRGPAPYWQNPFRAGVLFQRYRPKPNHVIVSVAHLDMRAHALASAILTLAQWNGGEAITKIPRPAFDRGLKLIPRRQ